MSLRLEEIVIDTHDHAALGSWWQKALGWPIVGQDDETTELRDASGPSILFNDVPEGKTIKNRLHLDWIPDDQDAEVARLVAMGATRVDLGQGSQSWVVLADPEGNEFCILSARD
ncbi:VOC family protein [Microbacteriaceae bacterium VKM Ac-2855]|nr:VOC family protein [Microbacteriaceae bacterium VKM Ac-2855]